MPADGQPFHVLENEGPGVQFCDETEEFAHQAVAGVVENAVADEREALAGRTAEYAIDTLPVQTGRTDNPGPRKLLYRSAAQRSSAGN